MNIASITSSIGSLLPTGYANSVSSTEKNDKTTGGFADIFHETLNNAIAADSQEKVTQVELLSGMSDDFAGLLIDSEKANIALSLTVQMRNKVLDAYNEIMRMSV